MALQLYNSLTRQKEEFKPADAKHVKMYVCGPTVYDRAHIGNARSVVVYDVLYRVLKHLYPKVTYVRNITDVDDKIIKAAKENGESINALTKRMTDFFHQDMKALNVLNPDQEPRATDYIPKMIEMIEKLIKQGFAYENAKHVLFDVTKYKDYGKLARRSRDEMIAGARVEVAPYKKNPGDFVLWKPADNEDDKSSVFDSPWGKGRPGWHIECSAMSTSILGENFDLHGGGADLMFPHHENEIAQSCCANPGSHFSTYWVHNGFLTVNGEKMSKSLGNFITVKDLLEKGVKGEVIRYALLTTRYSEPLDWTEKLLEDAQKSMDYLYRAVEGFEEEPNSVIKDEIPEDAGYLSEDLNTAAVLTSLIRIAREIHNKNPNDTKKFIGFKQKELKLLAGLLGLLQEDPEKWFKSGDGSDEEYILGKINQRSEAKKAKNWAEADKIREELAKNGIILEDRPDGSTDWRRK